MNTTQRRNTGMVVNPPIEGVQEFKMLTSGYSAEYGRYAGGMLTVVTKSGTNRLRGSLYEFIRNDMLDASGFFDPINESGDRVKSKLRRNQFGATVTGPPFTPRVANYNYTNGEASRPDRIASGIVDNPSPDLWFDRTVFPVVPTGSYKFGNSGRNILDGPGTMLINTSVSRRVRLDESRVLQFRLEAFNLPNHPNFNLPENNVDVATGGTINRAKNSRNLQIGLRLEF